MFISNAAFAINTSIVSVTEANGGANHHTISYDYHRDTYDSVWLTFQLSPVWIYDPALGRYIYAATPGENWSWKWIEVTHNITLSEGQISYVGGEAYCWSSGTCGAVAAWGIGISARCFDETEHRVELYHNGALVGSRLFKPTRFSPKIVGLTHQPAITPELPADNFTARYGYPLARQEGGKTDLYLRIMDNLGCQKPLKDVQVQVKNTILPGSGGHSHFTDADERGTGSYSALNPDDTFPDSADPTRILGKTNEQGKWRTEYAAGEFGLIEKIEISAVRPTESGDMERRDSTWSAVTINIPTVLTTPYNGVGGMVFADGGTCDHDPLPDDGYVESSARYMSIPLASRLVILDGIYSYITNGRHLSLNDASLPYGGLFDKGQRTGRPCHQSHRRGIDIDINHEDAQEIDIRSVVTMVNGELMTLKRWLINFGPHLSLYQVIEDNSLHFRFLPKSEPIQ